MDAEGNVRHHTGAAALAGALLIFFGFFYLAKPAGSDLYGKAGIVFFHTLRFGGLAMVAVAVWLSLGHLLALIVDAAVSVVVGVLFIVTGVVMIIDGGGMLQTLINVVCGTMFMATGLQYRREYQQLARLYGGDEDLTEEDVDILSAPEDSPLTQLSRRPGTWILRTKRKGTPRPGSPPPVDFKPPSRHRPRTTPVQEERPVRLDDPPPEEVEDSPTTEAPPPPEGYLADLAKKGRPRKK